MDGEKSHDIDIGNEGEPIRKKSLSRSSTGDGDEWVLVNSFGNEVENSGCQVVQNDVDTVANFTAPLLDNAAASLSIDLKPMANVCCSTISTKTEVPEGEKEIKQEPEDLPSSEIMSTISLASTVPVGEVDEKITETVSHAEEKTIKRSESSEVSSQISLLDHNDVTSSLVEDLPSSMASSAASDFGGYEMVTSLHSRADQTDQRHEEDEPALPALDDDLPANFVQACSTRIRNYIHAYDLALNWKLSLLVVVASAAVLGLGLGHFIGSTHVWWSRQNVNRQQEQLRLVEVQLVECLSKLHEAQTRHGVISDGCKDGYCEAFEKPSCAAVGDFEASLSGCLQRLEICQGELTTVETEAKKRSTDMVKAFHDLRWMRSSLMQVHATYEKLSNVLLAQKNNRKDDKGNVENLEELSRKLREAESRENELIRQEVELRRTLANLESTVEALNSELAKIKNQAGERIGQYGTHFKKTKDSGGDENEETVLDEEEGATDSEFNWNRLSELLQQLKDTTKLNQVFETYFDIFKDLKLPEINVSKKWLDQLPASLEAAAKNLKQGLDEKVHELEQSLYETNWDDYVQKAKDVTSRVGETVGTLWQRAKDLSDHVREQHGDQGEKIFKEIKTTVEKAAEVLDQRWEQAARFWRDVIGTRDIEEDEDLDPEQDDGSDQVWIYNEGGGGEDLAEESMPSGSGEWLSDEYEVKDTEKMEEDEMNKAETVDMTKFRGVDTANQVKNLREALKSSSVFSRYVTDEFADHYFRRLKQVGKSLASEDDDHSIWWLCQKLWWTHHSFAYGRQCSDKLMTWQRHIRVDVDVRQKLIDETPQLKSLIKKFANEDTPKLHDSANWVFEWAKNRQEMRQEDERKKNDEKESWLYERWRNRDQMRHQEDTVASKWLFRRGKEREKKRGDEHPGDRLDRIRSYGRYSGTKESKKQQNSFNWQKRR